MKVLKFGGTSVGTSASLRNVKEIVGSLEPGCIVVVSALGGLTDRLLATASLAAGGKKEYSVEMDAIEARHYNIIEEVVVAGVRQSTRERVGSLLADLRRLYDGIYLLGEASEKTLDNVVSFGERMSSVIVADMIPGARLHYSPDFVKTEKWFGKNIADSALTTELIRKEFAGMTERVAIAGGFISTDRDSGEITNLGRGGSDFTAALIAAALDADSLEIWTDVDGFMTSDPRIIPQARIIPEMSFVESMELCSFGAKVIYPPTIYPVFHKNIPIRILNTFNSKAPGTLISDNVGHDSGPVKGVSSLKNTCMATLSGKAAGNVAKINTRTFNALARKGISVYLVAQPEYDDPRQPRFSFAVGQSDAQATVEALRQEFAPELSTGEISDIGLETGLATIAVVGEHIKSELRAAARIINTLLRNGITPKAYSAGSSETTMTFVVSLDDMEKALGLIHALFFGSEP